MAGSNLIQFRIRFKHPIMELLTRISQSQAEAEVNRECTDPLKKSSTKTPTVTLV
jgi:hypothetical protein